MRKVVDILREDFSIALYIGLIFALIVSVLIWLLSSMFGGFSAAETVASVLGVIITALMIGGILELKIAFNQMKFETLGKIYEFFGSENKEKLRKIQSMVQNGIYKDNDEFKSLVSDVSRDFNRVGYYLYKGFIDADTIAEQFGGLIL